MATDEKPARILRTVKSYGAMVMRFSLGILGVWLMYYYVLKKYWFASIELIRSLEIIKNPNGRRMRSFDLGQLCRLKGTNSLTIGSSSKADIVLPHGSVADLRAKIMTAKTGAGSVVFVQPLQRNQILANDLSYNRQKEISERDNVAIGEFVLLYGCADTHRETLVQFADGSCIRKI